MKKVLLLTLVPLLLVACATRQLATQSIVFMTTTPSPLPFAPVATASYTPSPIPLPTATYTVSPEPDIAPNCNIVDEGGQLYLLSEKEFHSIFTTGAKVDRVLAVHYPEWANYRQMVSWSTQPVTLGDIINSASMDVELNLQINAAVILVTLGEYLNWQLPSNTDLFLKVQEVSLELNRSSIDWELQQNESLRSQYPEVANSGTYALYLFFNADLDRLQSWCNRYRILFDTSP
jgi:hypothetical protein